MIFNVSLSLTLFLITLAVSFLYSRYESKVQSLFFGGREFRLRDVVLLVAAMGIVVTILAFIPKLDIIKVFFLCIYSIVLFFFTYLVVTKWYFAVLSPAVFVALYLLYWNVYLLNFFAVIFAIFISICLGSLFIWKTTAVFAALLTIMDIVQVLGTRFMVVSGEKILALELPAMVIIPTFPSWFPEGWASLGLGDILLAGLLVIQTTKRYGKKSGLMTAIAIAAVFLLLETILLNFFFGYFPATVMVICGWLAALGARHLYKSRVLGAG